MKIGFDNQKYLTMQSEHIRERIGKFGDKLYLEFGGKLFDDYHASRVLPGFAPDSKLQMLLQLADQAEMIISINAADIENNKVRHDLGLTYDLDVLRLVKVYRSKGLYVSSVVITQYKGQKSIEGFEKKLEENEAIYRMINDSGANVVLVGVGCPKQEKWIDAHKAKMPGVDIWMALGATIDFEAGNVKRAPKWVQKIAMEWFYRFLMEPRRMFKRYFVDDPKFFWYLLKQRTGCYKNPFS